MKNYPKVKKPVAMLSQDERIHSTTIQLVTGALLSVGILLAGNTPIEAKSVTTATVSSASTQGSAIILVPASGVTKAGNSLIAQHYSHSSHASHASHHSHYSSR